MGPLSAFAIRSNGFGAQVITAGATGLLTRVQLSLAKDADTTDPLIIDIMPTVGDVLVFDESSRLARLTVQPAAGSRSN